MDASAYSRVSLLVVALGMICTCCNSFFVPPTGPLIRQQTGRSRLFSTTAGAASRPSGPTRMMAGDPDVSLTLRIGRSTSQQLHHPLRLLVAGPHLQLQLECGALAPTLAPFFRDLLFSPAHTHTQHSRRLQHTPKLLSINYQLVLCS